MKLNTIETLTEHKNLTEAFARLFNSLGPIDFGRDKVLLGIPKDRLATLALRVAQRLNIPASETETLVSIVREIHKTCETHGTKQAEAVDAVVENLKEVA